MNDPVYSHVPRSLVDQVYCVYFSAKSNAMTTCPAAPIFSAELRLGPVGLWDDNPMVSKSEIGHFQLGKGPSRGLLRDCEIFVNLNYKLSPSLLSPPVVWPRGENMMKP